MFTDGVTELRARGNRQELYGLDRALTWVECHRDDAISDLGGRFLTDLSAFGEPARHDDLTAVFLRRDT